MLKAAVHIDLPSRYHLISQSFVVKPMTGNTQCKDPRSLVFIYELEYGKFFRSKVMVKSQYLKR